MDDAEKELLDLLSQATLRQRRSSPPEPISRIIKLFRLSDPRARSRAARLVGRYSSYTAFLASRLKEQDHRVRANVVESIWGIDSPEVRAALRSVLDDNDHRVRTNVLVALYRLGDGSAIRLLREQSQHELPSFRASSAWAMGETGHPDFHDTLTGLTQDNDGEVRQNAERALARLKEARLNEARLKDTSAR